MNELERNLLGNRNASELELNRQRPTVNRLEIPKAKGAVNLVEPLNDSPGQFVEWILDLGENPVAGLVGRWVHAGNWSHHVQAASSDSRAINRKTAWTADCDAEYAG